MMRPPESLRALPLKGTTPPLRGALYSAFPACAAPVAMVARTCCAMDGH